MVLNETPTYAELKATCDSLQRQILLSLAARQELIDARNYLDRDLARSKAIQSYSGTAIHAKSIEELLRITTESIAEAFEVECSAVFLRDGRTRSLKAVSAFGFDGAVEEWRLETKWIDAWGLWHTFFGWITSAGVEETDPLAPGDARGLCQVIFCPFHDIDGEMQGLVLGGISAAKRPFYEGLDQKIIPSFTVFTQQVASFYHNFEAQELIKKNVEELREANALLQERTRKLQASQEQLQESNASLERTVKEISSLHTIGTAIISILDMDQLVDTVLRTIVRDLVYDRALILLVDEGRKVLTKGRIFGATAEMDAYVRKMELPISDGGGVLSRVAFSGSPILVKDARNGHDRVAMDIVTALDTPSFLAVPLKSKGRIVGVMAVDNYRSGAVLSDGDQRLISTLAGQVAVSIENARLYDLMKTLNSKLEAEIAEHEKAEVELRKAHDELELRVKERTTELSEANALLKQEVLERRRMERELQEAKRAAEGASRAKSDFLANMSHELRTPMNAVIGFSEMILDGIYGKTPAEVREVVGEIEKSGEHLLALINDVLDISKIEAGRMELRLSENAVEECIETVTGRLAPLAREKGLELVTEIREELPVCVFDQKRITQVLYNLVGNAIKFTRQGRVQVEATVNEDHLLFTVSDTGIGIPEAELGRIFMEFHQADSSINRDTQGTGLGLAIAKRFVDLHGGRIWAESKVGMGSTFQFTLPLRRM